MASFGTAPAEQKTQTLCVRGAARICFPPAPPKSGRSLPVENAAKMSPPGGSVKTYWVATLGKMRPPEKRGPHFLMICRLLEDVTLAAVVLLVFQPFKTLFLAADIQKLSDLAFFPLLWTYISCLFLLKCFENSMYACLWPSRGIVSNVPQHRNGNQFDLSCHYIELGRKTRGKSTTTNIIHIIVFSTQIVPLAFGSDQSTSLCSAPLILDLSL